MDNVIIEAEKQRLWQDDLDDLSRKCSSLQDDYKVNSGNEERSPYSSSSSLI